jgi:hypothetical protein
MVIYIIIGLVWTVWLEYYTTTHLDIESSGMKWSFRERIVQIVLWPFNVSVFIITFIKGLGKNE